MKPRLPNRRWLGLASLVGTALLAATLVVGTENDAPAVSAPVARSTEHAREPKATRTDVADIDLALLNRTRTEEIEDRLFTVPTPTPPPAPSKPVAPTTPEPARPIAPPLPFKFIGRLIDRTVTTAFVAYGSQTLGVKEGDEIDKLYRVEQIRDDRLVFVYLPMHESQTLAIGARP